MDCKNTYAFIPIKAVSFTKNAGFSQPKSQLPLAQGVSTCEAGVPFFSISASEFVEIFAGIGASRVRDLFEQAKKCLGWRSNVSNVWLAFAPRVMMELLLRMMSRKNLDVGWNFSRWEAMDVSILIFSEKKTLVT